MARLFVAANSDKIVMGTPTNWSTDISCSVWINLASLPGNNVTYAWYGNDNGSGNMHSAFAYTNDNGTYKLRVQWEWAFGTDTYYFATAALNVGQWYNVVWTVHVAATNVVVCYLDGVSQTVVANGLNNLGPVSGGIARIGQLNWGGSPIWKFDGSIDNLALWINTALTASEALSLARGTPPERIRGRVSSFYCWPIDGILSAEAEIGPNRLSSTSISGTSRVTGSLVHPRIVLP